MPPDAYTKPSNVTIFSPVNGSVYTKNPILLSVNVTLPESPTASLTIIYSKVYQADWLQDSVMLYGNTGLENSIESQLPEPEHQYFQKTLNLTDIPNGKHNVTITSVAGGIYPANNFGIYRFSIDGSSTVAFTTNTQPSQTPPSPSPTPTPDISTDPSSSPSQTQQPTLEPSPSPIVDPPIWFTPTFALMLGAVIIITLVVARALIYFEKRKTN